MNTAYYVIMALGALALIFGFVPRRVIWAQTVSMVSALGAGLVALFYSMSLEGGLAWVYLLVGCAWLFLAAMTQFGINREKERIS